MLDRRGARASLLAILVVIVAALGWSLRSYPNYDSYYALVWGGELADLTLPHYDVFRTPTPHPLFNLYTAMLSLTGTAAVRILTVQSLAMFVALIAGAFEMVRLKIGSVVALATVVVLLSRTDLLAFGLRSMVDVPFLALVLWAVVLELRRPRRGLGPLVLLALAGLLRPEAWILSGVYWLWLLLGVARQNLHLPGATPSRRLLTACVGLVMVGPLLWTGLDWLVTGDPLYSFVSTREVAGELERQQSLLSSITHIPRFIGASEPWVNGVGGLVGFALAVYALRSRMVMLAALAVAGVLTYLLIAVGGLSVISRYLLLPSVVACVGVAFALTGWTELSGRAGVLGRAAAVLTIALVAVRIPAYVRNFEALATESAQVRSRIGGLAPLLRSERVARRAKTCQPLLSPTHEAVPVLRYEFGLNRDEVLATTEVPTEPKSGVQLLQAGFLDPVAQTNISHAQRQPWTSFPLPGFALETTTDAWLVYSRC
ncbi:MAG TPA: hypothetical protein VMZ22_07115 [Acidimicrobiales bacterium]|nr:hypothetical protein [Acidimicrobiales bacterium]